MTIDNIVNKEELFTRLNCDNHNTMSREDFDKLMESQSRDAIMGYAKEILKDSYFKKVILNGFEDEKKLDHFICDSYISTRGDMNYENGVIFLPKSWAWPNAMGIEIQQNENNVEIYSIGSPSPKIHCARTLLHTLNKKVDLKKMFQSAENDYNRYMEEAEKEYNSFIENKYKHKQ